MSTHCLHIGINDYRGSGHDLAGCLRDVRDDELLFNRARRHKGTRRDAIDGCRFFGSADSQVTLTDRQATRETILAALRLLMMRLTSGDWGIVTWSGHGTYVPDRDGDETDGYDEALVCWGLDVILDDELGAICERRDPKSKLLVITDSCHSGTAHRTMGPRLLGSVQPAAARFLPPGRLPKKRAGRRVKRERKLFNTIHLAACLDAQFAEEGMFAGQAGGAFTWHRNDALCALTGRPTFGDWCAAIAGRLPNALFEQCPQVNAYARALEWKIPVGR